MDISLIRYIEPQRDYFKNESQCRCSTCKAMRDTKYRPDMDEVSKYKLNQIREFLGVPLTMTSGKRCKNHPEEYKKYKKTGKYTGQHYLGTAGDIQCKGNLRYKVLCCAIALGATGIALGNTYIHIDFRTSTPTTWTY